MSDEAEGLRRTIQAAYSMAVTQMDLPTAAILREAAAGPDVVGRLQGYVGHLEEEVLRLRSARLPVGHPDQHRACDAVIALLNHRLGLVDRGADEGYRKVILAAMLGIDSVLTGDHIDMNVTTAQLLGDISRALKKVLNLEGATAT